MIGHWDSSGKGDIGCLHENVCCMGPRHVLKSNISPQLSIEYQSINHAVHGSNYLGESKTK